MIPIPPEIVAATANFAKKGIITIVTPHIWKGLKKLFEKDHGSKVKMGAFCECSIEMFGDKACIIANEDEGEVVFLTAENIQSYKFIEQKRRAPSMHTYFYYEIYFKDGCSSYVRMRRKYRDAMEMYTPNR